MTRWHVQDVAGPLACEGLLGDGIDDVIVAETAAKAAKKAVDRSDPWAYGGSPEARKVRVRRLDATTKWKIYEVTPRVRVVWTATRRRSEP